MSEENVELARRYVEVSSTNADWTARRNSGIPISGCMIRRTSRTQIGMGVRPRSGRESRATWKLAGMVNFGFRNTSTRETKS